MANASSAGLGKWLDSGLVWWNHDNWPDSRSSSPSQVFSTTTSNSAACTRSPSLHRDRSTLRNSTDPFRRCAILSRGPLFPGCKKRENSRLTSVSRTMRATARIDNGFELLEEVGGLLRHETSDPTAEVDGDLSMKATRCVQPLPRNFVERLRHMPSIGTYKRWVTLRALFDPVLVTDLPRAQKEGSSGSTRIYEPPVNGPLCWLTIIHILADHSTERLQLLNFLSTRIECRTERSRLAILKRNGKSQKHHLSCKLRPNRRLPVSGPMPSLVRRNHFHAATDGVDRSDPRGIDYSRLASPAKNVVILMLDVVC